MASSYTIGDHFEGFIRDLVASGRYASASEVMRDGLRLLEDHEKARHTKLTILRGLIEDGLASGAPELLDMDRVKDRARAQRLSKAVAGHGK